MLYIYFSYPNHVFSQVKSVKLGTDIDHLLYLVCKVLSKSAKTKICPVYNKCENRLNQKLYITGFVTINILESVHMNMLLNVNIDRKTKCFVLEHKHKQYNSRFMYNKCLQFTDYQLGRQNILLLEIWFHLVEQLCSRRRCIKM